MRSLRIYTARIYLQGTKSVKTLKGAASQYARDFKNIHVYAVMHNKRHISTVSFRNTGKPKCKVVFVEYVESGHFEGVVFGGQSGTPCASLERDHCAEGVALLHARTQMNAFYATMEAGHFKASLAKLRRALTNPPTKHSKNWIERCRENDYSVLVVI